jgi:hypothetical protein
VQERRVNYLACFKCELLLNLNEVTISQDSTYVVDGLFEIFVIVGTEARSDRANIRFALEFAKVGCCPLLCIASALLSTS